MEERLNKLEHAICEQALLGDIEQCGDLGYVKEQDGIYLFALFDVLGHGAEARKLAIQIRSYLEKNYKKELKYILSEIHRLLFGSRGTVIALVKIDTVTQKMEYTGIGNITMRCYGKTSKHFVFHDGVVGMGEIRPLVQESNFAVGDILLLHSDGIAGHYMMEDISPFLIQDAETIAKRIMQHYATKYDDASCIVIKYLG